MQKTKKQQIQIINCSEIEIGNDLKNYDVEIIDCSQIKIFDSLELIKMKEITL